MNIMKKLSTFLIMNQPNTSKRQREQTYFIVVHVEGGIISSIESFDTFMAAKTSASVLADRHRFDPECDDLRIFETNAASRDFEEVWSYDPEGAN